ncbi:MAG: M50 family metallopeptidase [Acidimicrobiia bacterium]
MPTDGTDTLTQQLDPSSWLVLATGLAAFVGVAVGRLWRWSRGVVTIVHEAGHAVVAVLTGRRLTGIRLHSDTSGVTLSVGRPRGPGMVLTAAAGYASPPLVGLAGVALLAVEQVTVMLWATTAVLVAMLAMIRNAYGALSLIVTGGVVVGVSLYAPPEAQGAFGYTATWFMLFGGVRPVYELARQRRRDPGRGSDADQLARITRVPAVVWLAVFAAVALGALAVGGRLLLV